MKKTSLLLMLLVVAAPAFAQEGMSAQGAGAVKTLQMSFNYVKGFVVKSAEEMPEADFAFKPTPEVRSFGQIVAHVADANNGICAAVLGKANPAPGIEKSKTAKADLVAALKASYNFCEGAFSIPDNETGSKLKLFGMETTRLGALVVELSHNWEHYGNMVTYLRLKGRVPPSTQSQARP